MAARKKINPPVPARATAPKRGVPAPARETALVAYDPEVEAALKQAQQEEMRETADLQKDAGMPRLNLKNAPNEFDCVVLSQTRANAYWANPFQAGESAAPDCFSNDGVVGEGVRQIGSETSEGRQACDTCALNQFGSRGDTRGKACRNMRVLFVQRLEFETPNPELLVIPPTGLKNVSNYLRRLIAEGKPRIGVVTRVEKLEDEKSPLGNFHFNDVGPVPPERMSLVAQLWKVAREANLRKTALTSADMGEPVSPATELGNY